MREECLESVEGVPHCELALYCRDCERETTCSIAGFPKVTPDNAECFRLYGLAKAGLIHLDLDSLPAWMVERLRVLMDAIADEEREDDRLRELLRNVR